MRASPDGRERAGEVSLSEKIQRIEEFDYISESKLHRDCR